MASERDAGWQAFQRGDIRGAVSLLELACRQNPGDYEAHLYLGAAYGKSGRHYDAVTSITKAVQLQPSNPVARYNLGVALENAGFVSQAMEAIQQAIFLDPDYIKAKESFQRLQQQEIQRRQQAESTHRSEAGAHPPSSGIALADSPGTGSSSSSSIQSAAPTPFASASDPDMRQGLNTPDGVPSQDASAQVTQALGPPLADAPGYQPPASLQKTTALPSYGLLSNYSPSPHSPAGPTAIPEAYPAVLPPPNYQDELDFVQAFRDFGQIIISPVRFFMSQAGRQGFMSPICMLAVYLVIGIVDGMFTSGAQGIPGLIGALILLPINLVFILCGMMISYLILALMVHFLGMIFGNRTDYSVSFRAVVYADAPRILLGVLVSIWMAFVLMPGLRGNTFLPQELEHVFNQDSRKASPKTGNSDGSTGSSSPITASRRSGKVASATSRPTGPPTQEQITKLITLVLTRIGAQVVPIMLLGVVGWIWSTVLLIVAIHKMQNLSPLAACAVWFIMFLIGAALVALIVFACYSLVVALIGLALSQQGATTGVPGH